MASVKCAAVTRQGNQCKRYATFAGYCKQHGGFTVDEPVTTTARNEASSRDEASSTDAEPIGSRDPWLCKRMWFLCALRKRRECQGLTPYLAARIWSLAIARCSHGCGKTSHQPCCRCSDRRTAIDLATDKSVWRDRVTMRNGVHRKGEWRYYSLYCVTCREECARDEMKRLQRSISTTG